MNTETNKTSEDTKKLAHLFSARTCEHPQGTGCGSEYSLTLRIPYDHVGFRAMSSGNELSIYGMQPEEITALAHVILTEALKIGVTKEAQS